MPTLRNVDKLTAAASDTESKYKDGMAYHHSAGFQRDWPTYERFKAGDQWPAPTAKTANLPRPTFNIIDLIENLKVSTVMNEQISMHFSAQDSGDDSTLEAADLFSRYSETQWESMKMNSLNEEMLEIASNIGTGIQHFYWDGGYKGGNRIPYVGRLCGEVLDPINVFFGNPQQSSVQKQPYIIISYRTDIGTVRDEAKSNGLSKTLQDMITPDEDRKAEGYDSAQTEVQSSEKVTVLLHYYRKAGKVYFRKVASTIMFKPDTDTGMELYPLAAMQWKRRRKSVHGVGDTQGLIPNQKSINTLIAMSILSAQLTGWPKMAIDPQRVNKSKITNSPGEIVEVKEGSAMGITSAISFLNPGMVPGNVGQLVEQIVDMTKSMTSANDVATGQAPGANMSAAAINLLQRQNGVPIEGVKRRFYQFVEDVGRIWEEFFKTKFNLAREVKVKDDEGEETTRMFEGSKYKDVNMDLKIDVGPSSMYSEALLMTSLDKFLDRQDIDFEQYLRYAPNNVVPFKARLLREIERRKAEEAKLQAQQPPAQAINPVDALPEDVKAKFSALPPDVQQQILAQVGGGQAIA